jgi:hypothetical protein
MAKTETERASGRARGTLSSRGLPVGDLERRRVAEGRRVRGCGGEPQKGKDRDPGDRRLNPSIPSLLSHSSSSRLAVSARPPSSHKALSRSSPTLYPHQRWAPRSARRRRAAACRSPRPSVRTGDTSLLSGSCRLALLLDLSNMQIGRLSVNVTPPLRDVVLGSRRDRVRPAP